MGPKSIQEIAQAQLEARDQLAQQIMSIIHSGFATENGSVKRGVVQNYVYHSLGFHGRCGNAFARFISQVLEENGYRKSYSSGQRVYYGLKEKAPMDSEQQPMVCSGGLE